MAATTPSAVRRAVSARLEALAAPVPGYGQDDAFAWRPVYVTDVESLGKDGQHRQHLAYMLDDSEITYGNVSRLNSGEGAVMVAPLVLRFLYRQRPAMLQEDWDSAGDAAVAALSHLTSWDDADAQIAIEDGGAIVREIIDPTWILVTVDLTALYCVAI